MIGFSRKVIFLCVFSFPLIILGDLNSKKALIIGITGQDGSYLAEFLLNKGYQVHGTTRNIEKQNLTYMKKNYILHNAELANASSILDVIKQVQPDEIYNLGAQSQVQISYEQPEKTIMTNMLGVMNILESLKELGLTRKTKFYQASSSEMFGRVAECPQSEKTSFNPQSPYAIAKVGAFWLTVNYRETYNIFACSGILFNHESPRRSDVFVTRKITQAVANIKHGLQNTLHLGNLDAKRDWGYAKDYVESMWLMLQQQKPQDFIIATGQTHTVREFVEFAFKEIGIDIVWQGSGIKEKGIDKKSGKTFVVIDDRYFRPVEANSCQGNAFKAQHELGWIPKTSFKELVKIMVEADCLLLENKNK